MAMSGVSAVVGAAFGAFIGNADSDDRVVVLDSATAGCVIGAAVPWCVVLLRAWLRPDRERHWRGTAIVDGSGFDTSLDLRSMCDHEVSTITCEIASPTRAPVRLWAPMHVADGRPRAGEWILGCSFPSDFVDAEAVPGGIYRVRWLGRHSEDSDEVVLAEAGFTLPNVATVIRGDVGSIG
jgi:hypothetical protein